MGITRTHLVRNGSVLRRVKEERNILQTIKNERSLIRFGHIVLRNCVVKHFI